MAQEDEAPDRVDEVAEEVREEVELLDAIGADVDVDAFLAGTATPVFFGSALSNFGVRLLLDAIVSSRRHPPRGPTRDGGPGSTEPFSGLVFKIQANLDPRHRDRMAFVRVCSGRFERGETLINHRTGRGTTRSTRTAVFGRDRETVDEAYPGDVIGLVNAMDLRPGDSLHAARHRWSSRRCPPSPRALRHGPPDRPQPDQAVPQGRRPARRGGRGPGAAPPRPRRPGADLGGGRPLQFEVASWRMEHEFGAPVRLEGTRFEVARATDEDGAAKLAGMRDVEVYRRSPAGVAPMALFRSRFVADRVAATTRSWCSTPWCSVDSPSGWWSSRWRCA
jgi:peptide chain release factor 3